MEFLRKLTNWGVTSLGVITLLLVLTPKAYAVAVLDFDGRLGYRGGTVTISGTNVTASGIAIGTLTVTGAPSGNTTYDLNGAFLCSGTNQCPSGQTSAAVLSFASTSTQNFIQIVGGIPSLGIANGTVLLTGSFSSAVTCTAVGTSTICNGGGIDTKDPGLLTALGMGPGTPFSFSGGQIGTSFGLTLSTLSNIGESARLINTQQVTSVPEPSTLLLLGAGLVGLALWGRKWMISKSDKS